MKKKGGAVAADGGPPAASKATKMRMNRKTTYEIKSSEDPFLKGLSNQEKEVP